MKYSLGLREGKNIPFGLLYFVRIDGNVTHDMQNNSVFGILRNRLD